MDNRTVQVPISLLLDPGQVASAKLIWMALRLYPSATHADIEAATGLSRRTVRLGMGQARAYNRPLAGPKARVPSGLLAEPNLGIYAKLLYGLLQTTPGSRTHGGRCTYASLSSLTGLSRNTLRKAVGELVEAGWMEVSQTSQFKPIRFSLGTPELRRSQAEAAVARRRLKRGDFGGETIMQEYLSLLIDSDQYTDNARPGFLINPLTGERMELDRFYPPNVAFEFHGAQHDGATDRFPQAVVDAQQVRDLLKAGICLYRGIHLVIVRAPDLSLQGMIKRIGQSMPLRQITGHEPLIDLLEERSLLYQASARSDHQREGRHVGEKLRRPSPRARRPVATAP